MTAAVIAIVGAGPSGVSVLERLGANAGELLGDRALEVHLIDPYPPGPGRHWRRDQSRLLMLNTMAAHVTMFTDETVACDGPIRTGPSLHDWARGQPPSAVDADARGELERLTPASFPTRRLQSHYLSWVHERAVTGLPPGARVYHHRERVVDLLDEDGRERVVLASGRNIDADVVVLAVGHQDVELSPEQRRTAEYAEEHGLFFLPPGYTADEDLSAIRPGEPVVVRGLGLAFVDLMVLLTEGRGGRYTEDVTGRLRYLPSGREPVLYAGSRRGVPFPPKPTHALSDPPPPRFFDAAGILRDNAGELDFFRDVWPHAAKEIGWGYYHELFLAHPDRVHGDLETFARAYAATETGSAEERRLVRATVPDPADAFDLAHLDRPLADERFPHRAALERRITTHVERTLQRAAAARHSADAGAVAGALTVFGQLPVLVRSGRLAVRSWASDVDGWWAGLFTHLASGPPPRRLRELLALAEAGVVRFIGPDMAVHTVDGRFAASSLRYPAPSPPAPSSRPGCRSGPCPRRPTRSSPRCTGGDSCANTSASTAGSGTAPGSRRSTAATARSSTRLATPIRVCSHSAPSPPRPPAATSPGPARTRCRPG
ncbi:FAD/NAD(P)-binding protein [Amycolatopsis sp. cmx-8-4]|uniref:FAD/NAD(P)-binding protein n=1 Tax=Amycolatopsis sp. cmx-8-4 TaxID=2790947 RepID=UPI00397E8719